MSTKTTKKVSPPVAGKDKPKKAIVPKAEAQTKSKRIKKDFTKKEKSLVDAEIARLRDEYRGRPDNSIEKVIEDLVKQKRIEFGVAEQAPADEKKLRDDFTDEEKSNIQAEISATMKKMRGKGERHRAIAARKIWGRYRRELGVK